MFSFRKKQCPIDDELQAWVDDRFEWLVDEFGKETACNTAVVVPTPEFFPNDYVPTEEYLDELFGRMCEYMRVDPSRVKLQYYEDDSPVVSRSSGLNEYKASAAGLYDEADGTLNVWLNTESLDDPPSVVATMAHELGHVHLLGDQRLTEEDEDHEPLTDLLTVYLGLGVLTANAALRDRNFRLGNMEGWSVGRQGYLTMPIFGYALARFARLRNEDSPAWAKHLRLDVRSPFKAAMKFLAHQQD